MENLISAPISAEYKALQDIANAASTIAADLSGNSDSRIRGSFILIEGERVKLLLEALRKYMELTLTQDGD